MPVEGRGEQGVTSQLSLRPCIWGTLSSVVRDCTAQHRMKRPRDNTTRRRLVEHEPPCLLLLFPLLLLSCGCSSPALLTPLLL